MVVAAIQGFARRGLMGRLSASCSQEEVTSRASREGPGARRAAPRARALAPYLPWGPLSAHTHARGRASHRRSPAPAQDLGTRRLLQGPGGAVPRVACPRRLSERSSLFPGPWSGNQGAPDLGTSKTRRGCTRDILLALRFLRLAQPYSAELGFSQPGHEGSQPSRKPEDTAPKPERRRGKSAHSVGRAAAEAPGSAAADPDVSQLRLRPWPLSPAPGRVFHSTVWLGEVGDVLGAQGAGCSHKSLCRTSFPAAHTLVLLAGLPSGLPRGPCSPGHSLGSLGRCRESSQELPRSPKRETDSPIQCHHLPYLESADPSQPRPHQIAAWGRATGQALAPKKAYSRLFASQPRVGSHISHQLSALAQIAQPWGER
ncbi:uncharacterized protein LOC101687413 [Mustela putorius furo]|uniref:Uncharacterized protein LOC101687413 n=1 Tax=Mustela putorius furo TaxID=9669 RepID=A0A8U0UWF6_MUSPF|nr:uncharacterized protein LOC101687413 [Mustela putorius furo]